MTSHSLRTGGVTLYVLLILALVRSLVFGWWGGYDGDITYADVRDLGSS